MTVVTGMLAPLGWFSIIWPNMERIASRVIAALAASTPNRATLLKPALPAMLGGALVKLHYLLCQRRSLSQSADHRVMLLTGLPQSVQRWARNKFPVFDKGQCNEPTLYF